MLTQGEPVVFQRAAQRFDSYSETTVRDDWSSPETVLTASAGVEPVSSTEAAAVDRGAATTRFRLYLDGALDIDRSWRCTVRGLICKVIGRPALWRHPMTGWIAGTVVEVEAVDG